MLRVRVSGRYWPAPPPPPPFMVSVRRWPRHCRATRHAATSRVSLPPPGDGRLRGENITTITACIAAGFDPCPRVPTLLQHFTRAGQTAAQCQGPALGWAGWEEDGRQQDNSLFSGWIHPTFPSTHQNWGVAPCVTLVLEYAELQKLVPDIRVRDVNDDQSGSVSSSAFVSWSLYTSTCLGERIEEGGSDVYHSLLKISGENRELCHGTWALILILPAGGGYHLF